MTAYPASDLCQPGLRLGLGDDFFATIIAERMRGMPELHVTQAPLPEILARHEEGAFDAALVPPDTGFRNPQQAVVPGVGVFAPAGFDLINLYSPVPEAALESVQFARGEEDLALLYAMSYYARFERTLPRVPLRKGGMEPGGKAGFVMMEHAAHQIKETLGENLFRMPLAAAWHEATGLPVVLRVWACRNRAPYGSLRRILGAIHRDLPALPHDSDELAEEPSAMKPANLYYQLGTRESDSLRRYLSLYQATDRGAGESGLQFC